MARKIFDLCKWNNTDSNGGEDAEPGFSRRDKTPVSRANFGSMENVQKIFDLTPDEVAALNRYGYIDIDRDGDTMTLELA